MKDQQAKSGFTLVEILISVVVFTAVVLMSAGAVIMSASIRQRVLAMSEIQDEIRYTAEFISREIAGASQVEITKPTNTACNTGVCDQIKITRVDETTSDIVEKIISPTADNRAIQIISSKNGETSEPQIISSDKVFLRKLRFELTYTSGTKTSVSVSLAMEEASYSKLGNYDSSKLGNTGVLSRPTKMELRFIASNISNMPSVD